MLLLYPLVLKLVTRDGTPERSAVWARNQTCVSASLISLELMSLFDSGTTQLLASLRLGIGLMIIVTASFGLPSSKTAMCVVFALEGLDSRGR